MSELLPYLFYARVLAAVGDEWLYFNEIDVHGVPSPRLNGALRRLRNAGLLSYRRGVADNNDGQWADTDESRPVVDAWRERRLTDDELVAFVAERLR
jgi:hypothetical protein